MDQASMLIRDAIRYTISVYNSAVDRGAYADLAEVFTEDGEMIISDSKTYSGRQTIIESLLAGQKLRGGFEPGNFQRHSLGNSMIKIVDEKHARTVHFITVMTELGLDHSGVYVDDFVENDGYWWIKTRRANMEWARPESRFFTFPGNTYVTPREQLDVGLGRR